MRLLLDTHILLWVVENDPQLSTKAADLIRNKTNDVFVSIISLIEIAIKIKIGKLNTHRTPTEIAQEMARVLAIQLIPVLPHHLDAYQSVPLHEDHRDPFDRLLIATAVAENCILISDDSKFERYSGIVSIIQ